MERDGQRQDREGEGEGEAHGARGAGGGERRREASGERARDAPEIHGQGGLNGRAAPAGRPLGSCYTAGAAAAAQPRQRAHAAQRGPRGHDYERGDRELWRPALSGGPTWGKGSDASGGKGPFFPTRDRPALALLTRLKGLSGTPPLPARSRPSRQLRPVQPSPPPRLAHRTGSGPERRDLARALPWAPSTSQKMTLSAKRRQLRGGGGGRESELTQLPSPAAL